MAHVSEGSFDADQINQIRLSVSRPTSSEWSQVHLLRERLERASLLVDPVIRRWATDRCLRRYLRARSHNLDRALDMIRRSIQWRLEYHPEQRFCRACKANPRSHTYRRVGRTLTGQPVMFSTFVGVENYDPADNIEHLSSGIEHAVGVNARWPDLDPFPETYVWVLDFAGFHARHLSPGVGRASLALFSDHYPERLQLAIIHDAPAIFRGLWFALKPFIDRQTCKKILFIRRAHAAKLFERIFPPELCEWLEKELREVRDKRVAREKQWWREWCPAWDDDKKPLSELFPGVVIPEKGPLEGNSRCTQWIRMGAVDDAMEVSKNSDETFYDAMENDFGSSTFARHHAA
ncbi:hypothetical protein, conserved [Cyanidioschyzon merolae strain 10D]|jgi:hypothetical protein|uniref:CRAL-TRIO domain-containing protein n=1 Tax=Cyanidioschyzon merolae (strain NIES-3377 / 10D) TaxID=280699 RepID=M1V7K6_CYAM1|nr:hypothetical protein, conserved [Cyanidioschyzon merolae strain 10D]BAM79849.1 hypothetical protein, conserved [Cyanidioschyzon merolae strain 10D]|eukprot:XP_005536135.1 hypothetical protein, conserved [Cyanidioschyzon merolae strain 10D]